jgi:hypothetical protein
MDSVDHTRTILEANVPYRVIQWGTGNVGILTTQCILRHPELTLIAGWVHSADKVGRDIGTLAGLDPIDVPATSDVDALLASDADCVCYTATSLGRENELMADFVRILRAGKNIVNVSDPSLVHPKAARPGVYEQLQEACLAGKSSFYTNGGDPGWAGFGLTLAPLTVMQQVRSVRMFEIFNYGPWNNPSQLALYGFGKPDTSTSFILAPGVTTSVWGPTVALIADAIGVKLDRITEAHRAIYAEADFDVPAAHIPAGTLSGVAFEIRGIVNGEPRIVVEHVTKLRSEDFPEYNLEDGYRVLLEGEPNMRLDLTLTSDYGDHVHAGYVIAATPLVNAIPAVCDAPPGVLTFLDLKPHGVRRFIM